MERAARDVDAGDHRLPQEPRQERNEHGEANAPRCGRKEPEARPGGGSCGKESDREIDWIEADEDDPNDEASQFRHQIRPHEYTLVEEHGVRVLRGPADADRMMAATLLGSGGIAALLLLGAAAGLDSVIDLSLALALLAAFATVAFVRFTAAPPSGEAGPDDAL